VLETMMTWSRTLDLCLNRAMLVYQMRQAGPLRWKCRDGLLVSCNHHMGGDESFADDLNGNGVL